MTGAYWSSSIAAVRRTTVPGVAARSVPSWSSLGSERAGSRGGWRMSAASRRAPRGRLAPPVSITALIAAGLVSGKFAGASAAAALSSASRTR